MRLRKTFHFRFFLFFVLVQFAWAVETDAEILKDLDLYMNFEVLSEPAVMEETIDDWENEKPLVERKGAADVH